MLRKKTFENQLKQHSIKHTCSNRQDKIFMDWFLLATFSEKFEMGTVKLDQDSE